MDIEMGEAKERVGGGGSRVQINVTGEKEQ